MITTTFGKCIPEIGFPSPLVSHAIKASHRSLLRSQFKLSEERDDTAFERTGIKPRRRARNLKFPIQPIVKSPFKSFNFDDSPPSRHTSHDHLPYTFLLDPNPQKIAHALESAQRTRDEEAAYDSDASIRSRSSGSDILESEHSPKFRALDLDLKTSDLDLKTSDSGLPREKSFIEPDLLSDEKDQKLEQLEAEAALDVAKFLVDDFDRSQTTTEILEGLEIETEPSFFSPPSPTRRESFPVPPLLKIDPTQTILSENALALLRKASLAGKKVGLGTVATSLVEPGSVGMQQTLATSPIVDSSDIDKAEAAFSIAQQLVDWAESVVILAPSLPTKPKFDDEIPSFSLFGEPIQSDQSESEGSLSEGSGSLSDENEDDARNNEDPDSTQWISATDYFERRKAEYLLSRLSFRSPPQEQTVDSPSESFPY